ncbi:MAG: hypothetical protein IKJ26_12375 [Clostridia bacterium]|nr:hypothetical protein [Clostridia bacterium]
MEKLVCAACGAPLVAATQTPFLACEYCDTAVPNPYYDENTVKTNVQSILDEQKARQEALDQMCIELLKEMGTNEKLHKVSGLLAGAHFGTPLDGSWLADQARKTMGIPDQEKIYLVYDATLVGMATDGFALADGGLYYISGGDAGSRSWESFVTGAISCVDGDSRQQPGTIKIGSGLSFAVCNEDDSRLAKFVVDFHNQAYRRHTGESAPANWSVSENKAIPVQESNGGSLLGAAGALLAGALLNGGRTTIHRAVPQRTVVQRVAKPARSAARRAERVQQQARPVHGHGMPPPRKPTAGQRPAQQVRPGSILRPGGTSRPARMGGGPGRNMGTRGPGGLTRGPGRRT